MLLRRLFDAPLRGSSSVRCSGASLSGRFVDPARFAVRSARFGLQPSRFASSSNRPKLTSSTLPLQFRRGFTYFGKNDADDALMYLRSTPESAQLTFEANKEAATGPFFKRMGFVFRAVVPAFVLCVSAIACVIKFTDTSDFDKNLCSILIEPARIWTASTIKQTVDFFSLGETAAGNDTKAAAGSNVDIDATLFERTIFQTLYNWSAKIYNQTLVAADAALATASEDTVTISIVLGADYKATTAILGACTALMLLKRFSPLPVRRTLVNYVAYFRSDVLALGQKSRRLVYYPAMLTSAFFHRNVWHFLASVIPFTVIACQVEDMSTDWNVWVLSFAGILYATMQSLVFNTWLKIPAMAVCGLHGATCSLLGYMGGYYGVFTSFSEYAEKGIVDENEDRAAKVKNLVKEYGPSIKALQMHGLGFESENFIIGMHKEGLSPDLILFVGNKIPEPFKINRMEFTMQTLLENSLFVAATQSRKFETKQISEEQWNPIMFGAAHGESRPTKDEDASAPAPTPAVSEDMKRKLVPYVRPAPPSNSTMGLGYAIAFTSALIVSAFATLRNPAVLMGTVLFKLDGPAMLLTLSMGYTWGQIVRQRLENVPPVFFLLPEEFAERLRKGIPPA
ncbi:hypothetical protein BZA70DRAFT_292197 [Myxozyma melibiosi]|uniref:Peptidase S54 rhomboid domain-containing protein n=1 Tax=Myxozyma melibiosi TaxID=54550 RepID=A0ABR1EYN0_9ASCO